MKTYVSDNLKAMHHSPYITSWSSLLQHYFIFLFIVFPAITEPITAKDIQINQSQQLLYDVLHALEKATDFFSADFSSINVDGLFGIRLAQGNILEALRHCKHHDVTCPGELTQSLMELNQTIGLMGDKSLPYVEEQDATYFSQFSQTVDGPYIVPYVPTSIAGYLSSPGHFNMYEENTGDRCLSSLMGTFYDEEKQRHVDRCTVTEECWELMTKSDQCKYSITHQLLFFIIGEKAGCVEKLNEAMANRGMKSVQEQEKIFCGHILGEMQTETQGGNVQLQYQDLFLEQSVLCGTLGYKEVFPESWLRMVLSWQTSSGCFSLPSSLVQMQAKIERVDAEQKKLLKLLEEEVKAIDRAEVTGRKLLREKVMNNECLSHKSGLGFGTLGAYLRYLVQTIHS